MALVQQRLNYKRVIYVPVPFQREYGLAFEVFVNELADICGGVTYEEVDGDWRDGHHLISEEVTKVVVWFSKSKERAAVSAAFDKYTRFMLSHGEQAVMREWSRGQYSGALIYTDDGEG